PMAPRPPATPARPARGRMRPASTLSRVVFPAPLGPNNARVWPAGSVKVTSSSAGTAPKLCRTPSAHSIDAGSELVQVEGFHEIPAVPQVQHLHQGLHADVRGGDDHGQGGMGGADLLEQRDAVGI